MNVIITVKKWVFIYQWLASCRTFHFICLIELLVKSAIYELTEHSRSFRRETANKQIKNDAADRQNSATVSYPFGLKVNSH